MRAAHIIVTSLILAAIIGWGMWVLVLSGLFVGGGAVGDAAGRTLFLGMLCSVSGIGSAASCLVRNQGWKNLLIAMCGPCTGIAWLGYLTSSGGQFTDGNTALLAVVPVGCSWVIAGGFFFLRAMRAQPTLQLWEEEDGRE